MIEFIYMSSEGFPGPPARVTSEEFRRACGRFATGVTIATVVDGKGVAHGLTVSSFSSVSLHPPLVSICLGHTVSLMDIFRDSTYFGINILAEDQRHLSERFARKGHDRFQGVPWSPGQTGVPLIHGVLAAIECRVEQRIPVGDHDIFIGRMTAAHVTAPVEAHAAERAPLLYFASGYRKVER
jgi:flavin reductase (DIM6/NTAB) family NADH-FMN oxidoreductase RutF